MQLERRKYLRGHQQAGLRRQRERWRDLLLLVGAKIQLERVLPLGHAPDFRSQLHRACLTSAPALAQWKAVAPGVDLLKRTDPGPNRIRALRINPAGRECAFAQRPVPNARNGHRRGQRRRMSRRRSMGAISRRQLRPDAGVAYGAGKAWPDSKDSAVRGFLAFGHRKLAHSPAHEVVTPAGWTEEASQRGRHLSHQRQSR